MVRDLFSGSFQTEGEGEGLFPREKFRHHASGTVAVCSHLVIFSKRNRKMSQIQDDGSWVLVFLRKQ